MFLEKFDKEGVVRGPAKQTRAAYISREDVARTAAAVLRQPPGGIHDVTGDEALSVTQVAQRLSVLAGRPLHYQPESVKETRERLKRTDSEPWRVDLTVGWFEAIAGGELEHVSDAVLRFTGKPPLKMEKYFCLFPELLQPLRIAQR
jgi:uncharacterized protein YbjT (DUF2867 family)